MVRHQHMPGIVLLFHSTLIYCVYHNYLPIDFFFKISLFSATGGCRGSGLRPLQRHELAAAGTSHTLARWSGLSFEHVVRMQLCKKQYKTVSVGVVLHLDVVLESCSEQKGSICSVCFCRSNLMAPDNKAGAWARLSAVATTQNSF